MDSRLSQQSLPNGMVLTQSYDAVGRLIGKFWSVFGRPFRRFNCDYLETGLPRLVEEQDGSVTTYMYDFLDRVVGEERTGPAAYELLYRYDAAGNRITKIRNGAATVFAYDADNLPTLSQAAGGLNTQYAWDGNASLVQRLQSDGVRVQFHWDAATRLGGLESHGWSHVYSYDGLGRRTGFVALPHVGEEVVVDSLYDGRAVIRENVSSRNVSRRMAYTWDLFGLAESREEVSQTSAWLATDLFGSLRGFTNDHGQPGDYFPVFSRFGETISAQGSQPTPYAFLANFGARSEDNTGAGDWGGLINFSAGSAYYDPAISRSIGAPYPVPPWRPIAGYVGAKPGWELPRARFYPADPFLFPMVSPTGPDDPTQVHIALRASQFHVMGQPWPGPELSGPGPSFFPRPPSPVPPIRPITTYFGAKPGWELPRAPVEVEVLPVPDDVELEGIVQSVSPSQGVPTPPSPSSQLGCGVARFGDLVGTTAQRVAAMLTVWLPIAILLLLRRRARRKAPSECCQP